MLLKIFSKLLPTLRSREVRLVGFGLAATVALSAAPVQAQVEFAPAQTFSVETTPRALAIGDINGDGDLDLVTANIGNNTLSALLGGGDGTFAAARNFAAAGGTCAVATGDFDGDGDLDLAAANRFADNISVLSGNGNGTFGAARNYLVDGSFPTGVAAGDLDGDGDLDLVSANRYSANISLFKNNGNGTFGIPRSLPLPAGPAEVIFADIDEDGDPDLVVANIFSASVSVLLNDGKGTFAAARNFAAAGGTSGVVVGDFNGDGDLDMAATSRIADKVSVMLGDGTGSFGPAQNFVVGDYPVAIAMGDLDKDGDLDLITSNRRPASNVEVLINNGSANFSATQIFPAGGEGATYIGVGDLDEDGDLDVAVANGTASNVGVLLNTGDGTAAPSIESIAPRSGSVGTEVTITGTGFTGATAVTFGGVSAEFTVVSGTQITAIVPAGAASGPIAVTTPAGTNTSTRRFRITS
ncbi:FG-GAP-like repeat-containing protein [Gloeobacter violaceus]|nr:FG-GAP-like repeat-containing protein [Gloeobacter violaceus]